MTVPRDVVVVVPTYNERDNIRPLIAAVRHHGYRILIVDDSSPDGTGGIAEELSSADPDVQVLHRAGKEGLGAAYAAGFAQALASDPEVVCEMDGDFSHDPNDLPRLVAAVGPGSDVVLGSRYVAGGGTPDWSLWRKVLSRGGNAYARAMLGLRTHDATGGFRAFRAQTLRELTSSTSEASGYAFQVEIAWRAERLGYRVTEVPITFTDRKKGQSKMGAPVIIEAIWLITRWGLGRIARRLGWRRQEV